MNAAPKPSLEKPSIKRPWHHLHWSTVIVILLMAGFMTIIEIHGEECKQKPMTVELPFQHGSPWIYLKRDVTPLGDYERHYLDAWDFHGKPGSHKFSLLYLILDLLLVLTIIIMIAYLFEYHSRHRTRWFQFTLIELMLLILITAFVLSWWVTHQNQRIRELENVGNIQGVGCVLARTRIGGIARFSACNLARACEHAPYDSSGHSGGDQLRSVSGSLRPQSASYSPRET